MLLIINSLETPEVAPLPSMIELETLVYYVYHFYSGVNITMTTTTETTKATTKTTTTTYITIDSRKRASGNTCDAVYFLDRTVQSLKLSNMQFYNTIYNINQYNNLIAFSITNSAGTEFMTLKSLAPGNYVVSEFTAALENLMNSVSPGFTVTYSNITGLITISNSNFFLLNFTSPSNMWVVLGFLPQLYPTTTSITAPYALNLGMPVQVHIYISEVVNSYIGVQGGYDRPTFIVPVDGARGTIVNFRSENDCKDSGNRSNQESKFDFLATRMILFFVVPHQFSKIKIVRTNGQPNLRGSCQSIFSLSRHHPCVHKRLPTGTKELCPMVTFGLANTGMVFHYYFKPMKNLLRIFCLARWGCGTVWSGGATTRPC